MVRCIITICYSGGGCMSNRCKNNNENNTGEGILAIIILAILVMPIVGAYLLFFGKSEKQRGIGLVILIFYLVCWMVSKF